MNRFDGVGKAGCHRGGGRRHLDLVGGLLGRLAVGVAQAGLLGVDGHHLAGARHAGLRHRDRLTQLVVRRAGVARHSQLREQQAEQCNEHRDEAMAAQAGHGCDCRAAARFQLRLSGKGSTDRDAGHSTSVPVPPT